MTDKLTRLIPAAERWLDDLLSSLADGDGCTLLWLADLPVATERTSGGVCVSPLYDASRASHPPETNRPPCRRRSTKDSNANLRRSRHRDREKRELMYLRASADVLERELERLQRERRPCQLESIRDDSQSSAVGTAMWKMVARRYRHEREQAERVNRQLRALLKNQLEFAVQMQFCSSVPRNAGPANADRFRDVDANVFDMLLSGLDAVFGQVGSVLREADLDMPHEVNCKRIRSQANGGRDDEAVDLLDVTVLRSNYQEMKESFSPAFVNHFIQLGGDCDQVAKTAIDARTVLAKFRCSESANPGNGGSFEVLMALRLYQGDADRQVAIWRCLTIGDGKHRGISANETGLCIMYPAASQPGCTVMKRVRRLVPLAKLPRSEPSLTIEEFCNLTLSESEHRIGEVMDQFEPSAADNLNT